MIIDTGSRVALSTVWWLTFSPPIPLSLFTFPTLV